MRIYTRETVVSSRNGAGKTGLKRIDGNLILPCTQPKGPNRHLSKEDIKMANSSVYRCSLSPMVREMQIKTAIMCHLKPVRVAITKRTPGSQCRQGSEKPEASTRRNAAPCPSGETRKCPPKTAGDLQSHSGYLCRRTEMTISHVLCTQVTVVKIHKQPKHPPLDEQIKGMNRIHTSEVHFYK